MIGIMCSVTIVKFALMVYCRRFKNKIVRAYAQDHFFDVITNTVGLAAAVLAIRYYWWIDPTGAVIVSSYTTDFFFPFPFPLFYCMLYNWVQLLYKCLIFFLFIKLSYLRATMFFITKY